jgi:O-antigen/teichoic acid export membrane protein
MTGVRRAILLTVGERYGTLAVNFVVIAIVSRLLTPEETGVAVLGMALLAIADALREVGAGAYLVQHKEMTQERVRTAFTVLFLGSAVMAVLLLAFAEVLASLFGDSRIVQFLRVVVLSFFVTPFAGTILALMRRDMAFGTLGMVNFGSTLVGGAITISLAALSFGYMSFAWGGTALSVTSALLALYFRPDFQMFRPLLRDWRNALTFGGYNTGTVLLNRMYDALPALVLGRILSPESVGFYSRAMAMCQLPERFVIMGLAPVAMPAMAKLYREGGDLKGSYLRALCLVTAVQWPALLLTAVLAYPIVGVLLGAQWNEAVPLVRIMAIASLTFAPAFLTYPVLVAVGAVRHTLVSSLVSLPPSALILVGAAQFGVEAVAWSLLITMPMQICVALHFIRLHVPFGWGELVTTVAPSIVVSVCSIVAPTIVVAVSGFRLDLSTGAALVASLGAAVGWAFGLLMIQHPLADEMNRARRRMRSALQTAGAEDGIWSLRRLRAPSNHRV